MQRHGYGKHIAAQKSYVSPALAARRRGFVRGLLTRYSLEDWKLVRFSDECHFGLGPQRKLHINRKTGERYRTDCIQERDPKKPKISKDGPESKKLHVWAMIGWNYKSDLVFYDVPTNNNGKMTQKVYLEILEQHVKPCLDKGERFTLEEDNDSGHGSYNDTNKVAKWKEEHGLKHYFNCPGSPDLSIIENAWRVDKQQLWAEDYFDVDILRDAIRDAWGAVTIKWINQQVLMEDRLHDVLDMEGAMTKW